MPQSKTSWWRFLKDLFSWRKPYDEATKPPPSDTPAPPRAPEEGKGLKMVMKIGILAILVLLVGGCASYQQAAIGYEAAAIRGIQTAEDNNIFMWKVNACGTPLSAIMRHPDIVPALRMLCLPGGSLDNIALLMEDIKK